MRRPEEALHRTCVAYLQAARSLIRQDWPYRYSMFRPRLREANNSQNMANRKLNANSKSGVKGVCWHNGSQRWRARLQHNGKRIHLGDYKNKEAAEIAYEAAAKRHFGEFARLK